MSATKLQIARKALNRVGKRTSAWERVRALLKKEFAQKGITFCEVCGSRFGLSFAHRLKRRFITTEEELRTVALLCIVDHQRIEQFPANEMFRVVTEIISNREAS